MTFFNPPHHGLFTYRDLILSLHCCLSRHSQATGETAPELRYVTQIHSARGGGSPAHSVDFNKDNYALQTPVKIDAKKFDILEHISPKYPPSLRPKRQK